MSTKGNKFSNLLLDQTKKDKFLFLFSGKRLNIPHVIYYSEFGRRIYDKELSESNSTFVLLAICEKLPETILSPEGIEDAEVVLTKNK